jgi:Leucine-rich repeat (LRR) protein
MSFPNGNKLTNAELPLLLKFPNLRELICEYSQISDPGMETIGKLNQLTWLSLTGGVQGVTDKGMVQLKNLTQLQRLAILGSGITDEGVAPLAELTNLKSIDLTANNLTDASLQHFRGLKNLEQLYVHNTQITAAGIAELKQALPNCKIEN